jgi:hypothetical protein
MARILALALLLYGYGDPGFDGHRPDALDRPLHEFHRAVDITARQAQHVLVAADGGTGTVPALAKIGDQLRKIGAALAPQPDAAR